MSKPVQPSVARGRHAPGWARITVLIVVLVAPLVALAASPWAANTGPFYFGMMPVSAALLIGTRAGLVVSFLTPAVMASALVLSSHPGLGTLFMTVLAAAVGASSRLGWHGVGASLGPLAALALIDPPSVRLAHETVPAAHSPQGALVLAGFVLLGGLWATVIGRLLVRDFPVPRPRSVDLLAAVYFAAALVVLAGATTFIAMTRLPGANTWWTVLTMFVVVQPNYATSLGRASARVGGTLAGAVAASAFGIWLGSYALLTATVAVALSIMAIVAYLTRPYWVYVILFTPAVILMSAQGRETLLDIGLQRVLFTLGSAVLATVVLAVGHRILPAGQHARRVR